MIIVDDDDVTVEIDVTPAMKEAVFEKVLAYFKKHGCWSGESVMQRDDPQIYAAPLLSDIVDDIMKPSVIYK